MIRNIEEPAGISYVAVQPKPYRETKRNPDQEWENRALEAETKALRVAFVVMAALLVLSQVTTLIAVKVPV